MTGHKAARDFAARLQAIPKKEDRALVHLSAAEADRIRLLLREDAKDYYYSGLLSFIEALRGPQCGLYSWATVKLYYSVLHASRHSRSARHCHFLPWFHPLVGSRGAR